MISLKKYLNNNYLKLNDDQLKKLLDLDSRYNTLILERRKFNEKDILNLNEEMDKFFENYEKGIKYYPQLKLGECKYCDKLIKNLTHLLNEFKSFNECYLSKFYIESLEREICWCKFYIDKKTNPKKTWNGKPLDKKILGRAINIVKTTKFENTKQMKNISAKEAQKLIQKALDELGYDWEPKIYDNMVARMNVLPDKIIRISSSASFSDADIEGLIEHEVKGHIGRRYNGMRTGLYLMVHGLKGRNVLDEGLAIYNSIHNVDTVKPNVMFNIALKYVISYYKTRYGFCEVFDIVKDIIKDSGMPDKTLFKSIARAKREIMDTSLPGGISDDADYFIGYNLIKNMSDSERDDVLKYNIGIQHLKYLDDIKQFFKINKFKPIN